MNLLVKIVNYHFKNDEKKLEQKIFSKKFIK